jgi:hypothetical protein
MMTFVSLVSFSQKRITAEEMKNFSKGAFEAADFDEYLALDGHVYKVGDTLKIGRPSSNKTFAFIDEGSALVTPTPTSSNSSGTNSIIKRIYVGGTKKMGFRIYFVGKGICGMCPQYYINVEEAMAVGELKSFGMNREQAIAKLKEQKDLLDLGMITKEQFEKIKEELTPIVMKN